MTEEKKEEATAPMPVIRRAKNEIQTRVRSWLSSHPDWPHVTWAITDVRDELKGKGKDTVYCGTLAHLYDESDSGKKEYVELHWRPREQKWQAVSRDSRGGADVVVFRKEWVPMVQGSLIAITGLPDEALAHKLGIATETIRSWYKGDEVDCIPTEVLSKITHIYLKK